MTQTGNPAHDQRVEQVRTHMPELFEGKYQSALYVGASHRRQHFLDTFAAKYDRVVVLEVFEENAEYVKKKYDGKNVRVIHGDVRDTSSLLSEKFDVCFFWHGPEHLGKDEISAVLKNLESITNKLVVLGMPYGHYDQGSVYGNKYEQHLWDIYPEDMQKLEYLTDTLGEAGSPTSNMIAWKYIN